MSAAAVLARGLEDPKIRRVFDLWKNTPALDSPLEKNQELKSVMLEETPWLQQALDETCRLPECHAKQHLHRQAGLDGCVTVVRLSATFAGRRSLPGHGGIEPDRQRATTLDRA